jgi:hypothetical protein
MRLNEKYMIERYDDRNIALWRREGTIKENPSKARARYGHRWKAIRFYKTYEKAINGAISFLTLDEVSLVGDLKTILDEFAECKKKIDIFTKNIDAQMKDKEI